MEFKKPALSIPDQVNRLISRGLIVKDRAAIELFLSVVNYYRFSAYTISFEYPMDKLTKERTHKFEANVSFEQIHRLYCFDIQVRTLVWLAMERLEVAIRSNMINVLAGIDPCIHHEESNFVRAEKFHDFTDKIHEETEEHSKKETFLKKYKNKYTTSYPNLPIWMCMEIMTFGAISHFFEDLSTTIKTAICAPLGINRHIYESWLHSFSFTRNVCGHHNRLWNREMSISPKPFHLGHADWKKVNMRRLGTVLFCMKEAMRFHKINDIDVWKKNVETVIKRGESIAVPNFLASMGLFDGWENSALWK
ncbi:Abortive infection bacteriophage resistance protein [Parelusimicrobium proximum]|uniref:Abi family protein n=1 Tax=Parelusimicrobium proximum TaxID=3228953 RepID=UPI003D16C164